MGRGNQPMVQAGTPPLEGTPAQRVVAVTGASSFLGREIIKRLEEDRNYATVLALDVRQPDLPLDKTQYHKTDLTLPAVDGELAALFEEHQVDTVVHAAFLSYPTHASAWAHELEDIGTMHVLNACARTKPARVVLCSTTMVYGAKPLNPNFLSEEHPLQRRARSRFLSDKCNAERQVLRFAEEHQDLHVTSLRFAPLLGPTVVNFFTRFFARPAAPVMMGYDPLMQFVHESDAVTALKLVLDRPLSPEGESLDGRMSPPGFRAYNIVGNGVLPYTTILALMGKLPLPVPHFVAYHLSKALWATQVFDSPPNFLDFLRFLCVADGDRAKAELHFSPRYDLKRTILDFLGVGPEDGATDVTRAQG